MLNSLWDASDFESTVRDYEFTRRAIRQIQRIVASDDFLDMDSTAIFVFLNKQMEIVSFKDYLKRYLYERAEIREPFRTVEDSVYREIIAYSFDENAAPHSFEPTSTKWTAMIKGWLSHDSVRRSVVFLLGFGLNMSAEDVSTFLVKVIKDADYDFLNPEETVYWYCFRNRKSYSFAASVLEKLGSGDSLENSERYEKQDPVADAEEAAKILSSDGKLYGYLNYLKKVGTNADKRRIAGCNFSRLIDLSKEQIVRIYQEDPVFEETQGGWTTDKISSADIENVICCGIPVNKSGNLQKASASLLSRQFRNFRLSRQRIDSILKSRQIVDRYDLITLEFFLFSQMDADNPKKRLQEFLDETNRVLNESGMMGLHPVNPYEAFVMMCLLTECPLATYADVWEMSYND